MLAKPGSGPVVTSPSSGLFSGASVTVPWKAARGMSTFQPIWTVNAVPWFLRGGGLAEPVHRPCDALDRRLPGLTTTTAAEDGEEADGRSSPSSKRAALVTATS
jgi:hypothetical protein